MNMFDRIRRALARKSVSLPTSEDLRDDLRATEDWADGDLALCIARHSWVNISGGDTTGPKYGQTFKVIQVCRVDLPIGKMLPVLKLSSWEQKWFSACSFRKINPKSDAVERADSSFVKRLRSIKPSTSQPPALPPVKTPQREDA